MTTLEKVIKVVAQETGRDPASLSESTFLDSLGLDSLEFVCLMQAIQNEIANVPDEQWANLNTVGGIARACEAKL
jgi:acyl carrier protein